MSRRYAYAACASVVLFAGWVSLPMGSATMTRSIDDVGTAVAALLAAVSCLFAARRVTCSERRFWRLLAAASFAWAWGELAWGWYDLVLGHDPPTPSVADIGYLAAIPLAVTALIAHPAGRTRWAGPLLALVDGAAVATALLFLSWTFALGPTMRQSDLSSLGGFVVVAYPFGDVVIVFLLLRCLRGLDGGRTAIVLVLLGLLAMCAADATYTYLVTGRGFETGGAIDTGWFAGYLAIALGGRYAGRARIEPATVTAAQVGTAGLVAPYVALLAALAVIAVQAHTNADVDRTSFVLALSLAALVLLRQLLAPHRAQGPLS